MHLRDCSCAPILRFFSAASDGDTANRQISNRIFGQFFRLDVLYKSLNISQLYRQVAPQDLQICGGNFPKRKNRPQSCAKYFVCLHCRLINFTHVQQYMRVTISCWYCIALEVMLLFSSFFFLSVTLSGRRALRERGTQFEQLLCHGLWVDFDAVFTSFFGSYCHFSWTRQFAFSLLVGSTIFGNCSQKL